MRSPVISLTFVVPDSAIVTSKFASRFSITSTTPVSPPSEAPDVRAAHEYRLHAQGYRLERVRAPPDAAVEEDRHPPVHLLHDRGKGVEGGHGAVQLPASVVRDYYPVDSIVDREPCVRG